MIQIPLINYLFGGSLPIMGVFQNVVGYGYYYRLLTKWCERRVKRSNFLNH